MTETTAGWLPSPIGDLIRFTVYIAAALSALIMLLPARAAERWPTSPEARRFHFPHGWLRQAFCIHRHESQDWHRNHTDWRGAWSPYSSGYQFLPSTWRSVGGLGDAWQWSVREQTYRVFLVWRRDGGSWREWGTASACGL